MKSILWFFRSTLRVAKNVQQPRQTAVDRWENVWKAHGGSYETSVEHENTSGFECVRNGSLYE